MVESARPHPRPGDILKLVSDSYVDDRTRRCLHEDQHFELLAVDDGKYSRSHDRLVDARSGIIVRHTGYDGRRIVDVNFFDTHLNKRVGNPGSAICAVD